ncbi:MAG: FkbM family methyltransferase [Candidatus Aenigmarchaeota archaeon]|nr:FkbM family methyltransferase [Candidatus Aenigmarchaeota archaeon]
MVSLRDVITNLLKEMKKVGIFRAVGIFVFTIILWRYKNFYLLKKMKETGTKTLKIKLFNNSPFFIFLDDLGLSFDLFIARKREIIITDYLLSFLKKNTLKTFVDIGANIGYYTIILSPFFKRIISIEPSPKAFSLLKKNVTINKLDKKVELLNLAIVSKKDYNKDIYISEEKCLNISSITSHGKTKVKKVNFSEILTKYKPDFIKMDIEGYEFELIEDLKNSRHIPKYIFMEVHVNKNNYIQNKKFFRALARMKYKIRITTIEYKDFYYLKNNGIIWSLFYDLYAFFTSKNKHIIAKNCSINDFLRNSEAVRGSLGAIEFLLERCDQK